MPNRLPVAHGDRDNWDAILLPWLLVEHNGDGTHRFPSTVNVGAYGAIGDGVTDDTAAIQAAINAAAAVYAVTGARVFVTGTPGAVYKLGYSGPVVTFTALGAVHSALQIKPGVFLYNLSLSSPDYTGTAAATVVDDGVGFAYWGVIGCRLIGNQARNLNSEALHEAILFASSSDVWITDNHISLYRQTAVFAVAVNAGSIPSGIHIEKNVIALCQGGAIKLDRGVTDVWITDNWIHDNTGLVDGTYTGAEQIYLDDSSGLNARIRIAGNRLTNWGSCVVMGCGSYVDIANNYMAPPLGSSCFSVEGSGTMSYTAIQDNFMNGSANTPAVQPFTSNHLLVQGNVFAGNYLNPTFVNETGVGTANAYLNNVCGLGAAGTGRVRVAAINAGSTTIVRGNVGDYATPGFSSLSIVYGANPEIGIPGAPTVAVPATGVAVAAAPYDRTFYVTAGASTCTMAIEGGASPVVPSGGFGTIRVPARLKVTPAFASAPTWVVEGE